MIYAIIQEDDNGEIYGATFADMHEYSRYMFNPERTLLLLLEADSTKVWGKTREQKKNTARGLAIRWQRLIGDFCPSYMDFAIAGDYFTALGRRYGLLREFRVNGIC